MSYSSSPSFVLGSTQTSPIRAYAKWGDLAAVSITSIATVITPTSGKKVRLLGGDVSVSAAASVLFEDNASGTTVYRTPLMATATAFSFDLGRGYLLAKADNVLKATASAAGAITGTLYYSEE